MPCEPACFFNLSADPREATDLQQTQPALAASLLHRWQALAQALIAPNDDNPEDPYGRSKTTDPAACVAMLGAGGWWGPWAEEDKR